MKANATMTNAVRSAFYLGRQRSWGATESDFMYYPTYSDPFQPDMRAVGTTFAVDSFIDGDWHHMGMVYDYQGDGQDGIVEIYYDNELQKTFVNTDTSDEDLNFWLGRNQNDSDQRLWDGDIDEFFMYSGVITNFSNGYPAGDLPPTPTPPEPEPVFTTNRYETGFATADVINDWDPSRMTIYIDVYSNDVGRMTVDQKWLTREYATLTYSGATSLSDVIITSKQQCRTGNDTVYTEIAARTSNSTNGISLRVFGANPGAVISLYDGQTLLDTSSSSINSSENFYDVILTVSGDQVSATVSNLQDVVSLSGTVVNSLTAGDIRIAGFDRNTSDESSRSTTYYIKVEEQIDDPTPRGTLLIVQ
jgi:hypothetical protein